MYESVIHSLYSPVTGKKIESRDAKNLVKRLQERLEISAEKVKKVDDRVESQQLYSTEVYNIMHIITC